jgi:hypothetical protein
MRILNQQDNFNENYFYAKYARKKLNQWFINILLIKSYAKTMQKLCKKYARNVQLVCNKSARVVQKICSEVEITFPLN